MKAYLGDWVEDLNNHYVGRVCGKHALFSETSENDNWFDFQLLPLEEADKAKPWYSILTIHGGSILVPERCIKLLDTKPELKNVWEDFYFRK